MFTSFRLKINTIKIQEMQKDTNFDDNSASSTGA